MTITRLSGFHSQMLGVKVEFCVQSNKQQTFQGGNAAGSSYQQVEEVSEVDDDEEAEISYDTDFD